MNANEVLANLAGDEAHPNDHVNMGQSSNDVFPSAVHLAALGEVHEQLYRASRPWHALAAKADEFADIIKAGTTHLMDAVPVTLEQEFGGYAARCRLGAERIEGGAGAHRPDPARRHRETGGSSTPARFRRTGARQARRGDRPRDHGPANRRGAGPRRMRVKLSREP